MSKKFILCDLDGTLLDLPNGISPSCLERLNALIDRGLNFSIATGRDLKNAKKAVKGLKLKFPVILTNGALLADIVEETYLKITHITKSIFQTIFSWSTEMGLDPIVLITYDPINKILHSNKGKWGKKGIKLLEHDQIQRYLSHNIVSLQFHAEKSTLEPLLIRIQNTFSDHVNIIFIEDVSYRKYNIPGEWFWLEINSHLAGKEKMMVELASRVNTPMEDFVVFGDNLNDLTMMQQAGFSVAVGDAMEEVKKCASDICLPHTECGVIQYLEDHFENFIGVSL
ncbi:MAG: HAD family hydrolase [Promethearchaeota archaeon]